MSLADRVADLESRVAIRQLRYSYATHLDAEAWERWGELFANDAVFKPTDSETIVGRESITEFGRETIDDLFSYSAHWMANPRITIDGDRAFGGWYVIVFFARPDGTAGWHQGRYEETYIVEDGEWVFEKVSVHIDAETSTEFTWVEEYDNRRGHNVIQLNYPA